MRETKVSSLWIGGLLMDKLVLNMAKDMSITEYLDEKEVDFYARVIYSALGLWCLNISARKIDGELGVSKTLLTRKLIMVLIIHI